jgi:Methyltransferase domain
VSDLVAALIAEPPPVHTHLGDPPRGCHPAEESLYRFLDATVREGDHTLETGCGISTVIFTERRAHHTCVVNMQSEADITLHYCESRGIPTDLVTFRVGSSDAVLPVLDLPPLDLLLIDGCHGFPFPHIDWFYGARHLREGGLVVVDDVPLPAPAQLVGFLDRDPRWQMVRSEGRWVAYRLAERHTFREEFVYQPFYESPSTREPPRAQEPVPQDQGRGSSREGRERRLNSRAVLLLFAGATILFRAMGKAIHSRRSRSCPDCRSRVDRKARVCPMCGCRFPPR